MPGLPDRPNLDQLRRQARELLRAAVGGEPLAVARIRVVSERMTLSAAQLALAREYGYRSWPALRTEVERRRSRELAGSRLPAGSAAPGPLQAPGGRWSFGGAAAIETLTGMLLPEGLVAGADGAALFACLTPWESAEDPDRKALAARHRRIEEENMGLRASPGDLARRRRRIEELKLQARAAQAGDIAVVVADDQGATYTLRVLQVSSKSGLSPKSMRFRVDPVPGPGTRWIELGGQNGTTARLLPSPRTAVRPGQLTLVTASAAERELTRRALSAIALHLDAAHLGTAAGARDDILRQRCDALLAGASQARRTGQLEPASRLPDQLARLCSALTAQCPADELPPAWSAMLDAAGRTDGARHHLDIGATVPPIDGVSIQLDSLVSSPGSWRLHLRAAPEWQRLGSENPAESWDAVQISAEDDRGCSYAGRFDYSIYRGDHAELSLWFVPRLDPLASSIRLTCTRTAGQVAIDLDLDPAT